MEFASTLSQPKVFGGRKGQEQDMISLMTQCKIKFHTRPKILFAREIVNIKQLCRQNIVEIGLYRILVATQFYFERWFHGGVVRILSPLLIHHLTHELSYALRFHNKLQIELD